MIAQIGEALLSADSSLAMHNSMHERHAVVERVGVSQRLAWIFERQNWCIVAIFIAGHERGCESLERFVHAHNTV